MEMWKRNLYVCWFGLFVGGVGMSQLAPVLPLYIKHLGIDNTALIEQFSGIAFGVTYIRHSADLFSKIIFFTIFPHQPYYLMLNLTHICNFNYYF